MAEKRQDPGFTVTDRRLFTEDGELRGDTPEKKETEVPRAAVPPPTAPGAARENASGAPVTPFPTEDANAAQPMPPAPTAAEQTAQADAYRKSSQELDSRVELSGRSAKEFEMTFERFLASLYMTAMLQLGLMHQQGDQPRLDIIGARQTIDTLSLLAEKTKGNLTPTEETFLQNSLYEVRMAYVEVTNALSRPPQPGAATGTSGARGAAHEGRSMKAVLTVLGSGTSMGVPTLGCDCSVCRSGDPHDRRTRPSVMIEYAGKTVLIDTTPDFYAQAIREHITRVDAVFYTHTHADHILGIDDLRPLSYVHKPGRIPLYARPDAAAFLRRMFSYIFDADYKFGGLPQLELRPIDGPVEVFGARFEPVRLIHGEAEIYGYRFGSAAYLTDHSEIPEASFHQLEGLDVLFLDALRHKPHPTHSTVENSLRIVERVKAKRAYFTHICHDLGHQATNAALPPHVRLSYDGLKLEFEI